MHVGCLLRDLGRRSSIAQGSGEGFLKALVAAARQGVQVWVCAPAHSMKQCAMDTDCTRMCVHRHSTPSSLANKSCPHLRTPPHCSDQRLQEALSAALRDEALPALAPCHVPARPLSRPHALAPPAPLPWHVQIKCPAAPAHPAALQQSASSGNPPRCPEECNSLYLYLAPRLAFTWPPGPPAHA